MFRAAAALSLAACFAPAPATGVPCDDAMPRCPGGLVCVAQPDGLETCETTGGGGPLPDDRDADGISDPNDNCPDDKNLDQGDEDLDGQGDVCDSCPPFAGDEDSDQDGVGDACDPNPETPGDELVSFIGFQSTVPGWETNGAFIVAGGEGLAMANDMATALATFPAPDAGRVEIRTQAQLVSINAEAPNLGAISIVDQYVPATDKGAACQLSALGDGEQQQLRIFNLDTKVVVDTAGHPFGVGGELDLRSRRTGQRYSCRATAPVLELAADVPFMTNEARVGLRIRGATAIVHWIMVIGSP